MRLIAPQVRIREGSDFAGVAHLESTSGVLFNTTNVQLGNAYLYDLNSATPDVSVWESGNLEAATFMFDTLQSDGYADYLSGGEGYNFLYVLTPDGYQMLGGHTYRLEFGVATHGYGGQGLVWLITVGEMYSL